MTRDLIAVVVPFAISWLCWFVSLRRTPYRALWFVAMAFYCLAIVAGGLGAAADPAVTNAGLFGVDAALAIAPALVAVVTEAQYHDNHHGSIGEWRRLNHRRPKRGSKTPKNPWSIKTVLNQASGAVCFYVKHCDGASLEIGQADPVANMDEYQTVMARTQQVVETYNALKVNE